MRPKERPEAVWRECQRSQPDYVLYCPRSTDGSTNDSANVHILVFEGPDRSLMAIWTQSARTASFQGSGQWLNRIMFSCSTDDGCTWSEPQRLAGPADERDTTPMTCWGFPLVSRSGRIYVLWNQNQDVGGWIKMHTGTMSGIYSDDNGASWSPPQDIPMPRSPFDDPEGRVPPEWIVWQVPMRDLRGGFIVGYTHWLNEARARYRDTEGWTQIESVCEFMRFENVDQHPEPRDLVIRYSAWAEEALRVPYYRDPLLSIAQEPSLVRLPDDRLFCVMRSNTGYIWYSLSADDGDTWCNPRPLLRRDHGLPILQPLSPCPIYQISDGRYVLLHHNNRGDMEARPENMRNPRRPAFLALGEFRQDADQPIWFSDSKEFADNGGYDVYGEPITDLRKAQDVAVYPSFTTKDGQDVLWYCDRMCFLLGKRITPAFLADLVVPPGD